LLQTLFASQFASSTQNESETDHASSEKTAPYNHASTLYNHAQLRSESNVGDKSETETTSTEIPRVDVTAVTSLPAMTSPIVVSSLRVKLCNAKLWRQFHASTNEMIITKAGRQGDIVVISINVQKCSLFHHHHHHHHHHHKHFNVA